MNFVATNNYDGVDIDWEQPEAADQTNCTLLMQALRQVLPSPQYLLSMAVPTFPSNSQYDFNALNQVVDFYNLMSYDFHGPWSTHAGHNAPLFANRADPDHTRSIDDAVDTYVNQLGIPRAMINLGLPFYGYEFPGVNLWDACSCASAVARKYGDFIKQRIDQNGWTSHLDPVSMAPYLTANDATGVITYDDAASLTRKVAYALSVRDLGGVFIWEISQDFDGAGQDLLDSVNAAYLNATPSAHPAAMRKAR
jgi:chitinase